VKERERRERVDAEEEGWWMWVEGMAYEVCND
jgi:hypothetical protein